MKFYAYLILLGFILTLFICLHIENIELNDRLNQTKTEMDNHFKPLIEQQNQIVEHMNNYRCENETKLMRIED